MSLAAILEGIHISLVICVWGYKYHGDTHITVTDTKKPIQECKLAHGQKLQTLQLRSLEYHWQYGRQTIKGFVWQK